MQASCSLVGTLSHTRRISTVICLLASMFWPAIQMSDIIDSILSTMAAELVQRVSDKLYTWNDMLRRLRWFVGWESVKQGVPSIFLTLTCLSITFLKTTQNKNFHQIVGIKYQWWIQLLCFQSFSHRPTKLVRAGSNNTWITDSFLINTEHKGNLYQILYCIYTGIPCKITTD